MAPYLLGNAAIGPWDPSRRRWRINVIRTILICVALGQSMVAAELIPLPLKMTPGAGKLRIESTFGAAITGYSDARLVSAAARFVRQIAMQTGVPIAPGNV